MINLDEIGDDKLEKIKHDYFEKKPIVFKFNVKLPFLKSYQNKTGINLGGLMLRFKKQN